MVAEFSEVPPNTPPSALDDAFETDEGTTLVISAPGVLANDTDAEGQALTASLVGGVSHGTLTLNTDGGFTYVPAAGFSGTDSFSYAAHDGAASSNTAVVTLTMQPAPTSPIALPDSYTVNE